MKIFILNAIVIIYSSINGEISQLRHVHILYRHGDRSPISIFPTDSNQIDKWNRGLGQLTNKGIMQHFQLGLWLRKRYESFVGKDFSHSSMYVRSSDMDRTLMSAESNLAGFFFNSPGQIIKGLKWRPTPIHTVETKSDLLLQSKKSCPNFKDLYNRIFNSEIFKKKLQPYQSIVGLLREKTGIKDLTLSTAKRIHGALFSERQNNMKTDGWVTDEIWEKLMAINRISWEVLANDILAKVGGGLLLKEIVENIISLTESRASLNLNRSKFIIYSGHNTNMVSVTSLLGIFDSPVPYASCLLVELHHVPSRVDKWAIKVIYKNYTDSTGNTNIPAVILPGCDSELCPLNQFIKLTKPKMINEIEFKKICKL